MSVYRCRSCGRVIPSDQDCVACHKKVRTITLECDAIDFDAIQNAISRRQAMQCLPEGGGNTAGRVIAEICRGWIEMLTAKQ